jgi:PAS domain S-box-containing protein
LDNPILPPGAAEESLRDSERRYRELVEGSRNVVFRLSDQGDVTFLNHTFEAITGRRAHEWLGRPFVDLVHADDRPRAAEAVRRTLAGESPIPFDLRVPAATGELCVLEVTLAAHRRDEHSAGLIGTAVDVTERRLLEADAARQERQLAVAQQLAQLGSFEWDVRVDALHGSDELRRIYGLARGTRATRFEDLLERVVPEDRARVRATVRRAVEEAPSFVLEVRLARADGSVRQIEMRGEVVRDEAGRASTVIGSCQDVTDRREQEAALRRAEAEYRQLVESVQAIVWRADAATLQLRFVSREAEELLGYPLSRWLEEPRFWREHVHPDDRDWVVKLRQRAAREGREHEAEYRMIAADGRVLWVRDAVRVRGGRRRAAELFGVTIDVTERHRAEEELRRSREQLQDLSAHIEWVREQERSAIAREIHDELGQALTALRMDVSWVRSHLPSGAASPALAAKLRSMDDLIDDTIVRARRICTELRPGVLDDLGLEAAVEWQAQEFARRAGVPCDAVVTGRLPALDREVSTALFRILQESLTNVTRHAAASRVRVELRQEGGRVVLEVSDDGRGAAATQQPGHRSLGVLGMKERARRLGGTLTVTTGGGKGTVVQASIPLARGAHDPDPPLALPAGVARVPASDPSAS